MKDTSLAWWHSDSGELPENFRVPWDLSGTGATLTDSGVQIVDSSAVDPTYYSRKLHDSDSTASKARARDWVWFQIRVKGVSAAPAWTSALSPIGFYVDDGAKAIGVSIGSSLAFIDPYTGDEIAVISSSFPWLTGHVFLLVKSATQRWQLWVDGKLVMSLAYLTGIDSAGTPPRAGFGCLDPVGLATAVFEQPELGLNQAVPPQWKVDQTTAAMPAAITARWTEMARAAMRTTIGMMETPLRLLEEAWRDLTASRVAQERYDFDGDVLPSTPWTLVNSPDLSIERERVRIDADGATTTGVTLTLVSSLITDIETDLIATWTVREYTADADGRVGPYMQIFDGTRVVTAQLVEITAGESWAWVFTNNVLTGAYSELSSIQWRVDVEQAHEVEIEVLGQDWVLLIVNKRIVDRLPYGDFPASGATASFGLASRAGAPGAVGVYLLEYVVAQRQLCDLARRPIFLQDAAERLIFVGGCERNDEIETWKRHHHEVEDLRGSTQTILLEMKRMACNEDCYVVRSQDYASWYLELSYPEVTPIWLELDGFLSNVFVEFGIGSINFSPQELADLAARYLVPTSAVELEYFICLAARMTGNATTPGPGLTRLPVTSSEGFEVGDAVTVRDAANTVQEDHTVQAIPSGTSIDIDSATTAFVTNDVVRKILAET